MLTLFPPINMWSFSCNEHLFICKDCLLGSYYWWSAKLVYYNFLQGFFCGAAAGGRCQISPHLRVNTFRKSLEQIPYNVKSFSGNWEPLSPPEFLLCMFWMDLRNSLPGGCTRLQQYVTKDKDVPAMFPESLKKRCVCCLGGFFFF